MTQKNAPEYQYTRLASQNAVAIQIASGRAVLHYITVNLTTPATVGLCDGTATVNSNSPNIGKMKASIPEGTYRYDVVVGNGLRIIPSGHLGDLTVCWSQG